MSPKTLILAAAAVLSLGVGSAFAGGDGPGNTYFQAPATQTQQHANPAAGQSAGDAGTQSPSWIQNNATGGGN